MNDFIVIGSKDQSLYDICCEGLAVAVVSPDAVMSIHADVPKCGVPHVFTIITRGLNVPGQRVIIDCEDFDRDSALANAIRGIGLITCAEGIDEIELRKGSKEVGRYKRLFVAKDAEEVKALMLQVKDEPIR